MTQTMKGAVLLASAVVAVLATLVLVAAPLLSAAEPPTREARPVPTPSATSIPVPDQEDAQDEPRARRGARSDAPTDAPQDDAMKLTIPALDRVDAVPVRTAPGSDERPLRFGALHVEGTGFPWQRGANTYIAGHRLGFPGTPSERLFWDLDELETGDPVRLEDANGRRYEYRVSGRRIVGPNDVTVAKPIPGKSVVSLQTCTLPDYKKRLVVQAELVAGPGIPHRSVGDAPGDAFGLSDG